MYICIVKLYSSSFIIIKSTEPVNRSSVGLSIKMNKKELREMILNSGIISADVIGQPDYNGGWSYKLSINEEHELDRFEFIEESFDATSLYRGIIKGMSYEYVRCSQYSSTEYKTSLFNLLMQAL